MKTIETAVQTAALLLHKQLHYYFIKYYQKTNQAVAQIAALLLLLHKDYNN